MKQRAYSLCKTAETYFGWQMHYCKAFHTTTTMPTPTESTGRSKSLVTDPHTTITNGASECHAATTNGDTKTLSSAICKPSSVLPFYSTSYPSNCLLFLNDTGIETKSNYGKIEQANLKLNILVVGAGIGGLATAVSLARRGHKITVFEQAPELAEVLGTAIHLCIELC